MDSKTAKFNTHVSLAMRGGNVRSDKAVPPLLQRPDRVEVRRNHKRNVIDPLSAAIMPVSSPQAAVGPEACRRTLPVFDGWTRYDVKLSFKETRNIRVGGYQGPVAVCAARWVPVAGHREGKDSVEYMRNNSNIETWMAPVGETKIAVPVRVQIGTQAGQLVVTADKLTITDGRSRQASN